MTGPMTDFALHWEGALQFGKNERKKKKTMDRLRSRFKKYVYPSVQTGKQQNYNMLS